MITDFFKKNIYLHLLVIAIAGLIAYSNSFTVPFQFDDRGVIAENPAIRDIGNLTSSAKVSVNNPRYEYNSRRYIGYLTLALNYQWGGLDVTGYHIVNLLIHLINAILVYFLVSLTFKTPYFSVSGTSDQGLLTGGRYQAPGFHPTLPDTYPKSQIPQLIALFAALLFVTHPVQTQAVTYIVQRFTSLAALFYLLSIVMYVKGRLVTLKNEELEVSSNEQAGNSHFAFFHISRFTLVWYLLSLVSAVLAMKTKEIAFTLPIMILLYELTFFRSSLKKKLLFLLPVLLTLVIIPMSMIHIDKPLGALLSDLSERTRLQTDISRGAYLMTEMRVIVTYIRLILLPINQNLDYDFPISHSFFNPSIFFSFLLLSAFLATAVYLLYRTRRGATVSNKKLLEISEQTEAERERSSGERSRNDSSLTNPCFRLIGFGILWFFLALSVESSFIPIVDVIFEHRLYLPSIGAFIALSAALYVAANEVGKRWSRAKKAVIPLALIMVMALSGATFARNSVWQDELRLWQDVVNKSMGSPRAHNNLGFFYTARGMNDQAIDQFVAAIRLRPGYINARINLGIAYNAKGMYDQAIDQFIIVLSMSPNDADAYNNIGISLVSKGMPDEGITDYKTALRLQPDYAEVYNNLGVAYGSKGLLDQARDNFEQAIRLRPDYFEAYYNLALIYEKTGDYEKASALFSKAKRMNSIYQ